MKLKKILVCLLILICLFSVGAISAEDVDSVQTDFNTNLDAINTIDDSSNVSITTENLTKYYKGPQPFGAYIFDADGNPIANQTVIFHIFDKDYKKVSDENGYAKLNINAGVGQYDISTTYNGITVNNIITVKSHVETNDLVKSYKNASQFVAKIYDDYGRPLQKEQVTFRIFNKDYIKYTDENGEAVLNINCGPGTYSIVTLYGNEAFTNNIKVLEPRRNIETNDLVKVYKNSTPFSAKILDDNDNPLQGETVLFTVVGKTYSKITNEEGVASLNINLAIGNYTITTTCKDNSVKNNITVIEAIPQLVTENLTKYYKNGSEFNVKVLDQNGQPAVEEKVTINILGKDYVKTTNAKGIATLNINLNPGTYSVFTKVGDDNATNTVEVLAITPTVITNDLTKYFKNSSQFVVKVVNQEGQPVVRENVVINVCGKDYTRTTDENGEAVLNINLYPGDYTVTTKAFNKVKTNKVTVLPVISGEDKILIKSNGDKYSVYIVDAQGNPKNGGQVTFDIDYCPVKFVVASDNIQGKSTDAANVALLCQYLNEAGYSAENAGVGPSNLQKYGLTKNSYGKTGIYIGGGSCPGTLYDFAYGIGRYYHFDNTIFAFASYSITTEKGWKYISPEGLKTTPMTKAWDDNFSGDNIPVGKTVEQYCNENPEIDYVAGFSVRELANEILAKLPKITDVVDQKTVTMVSDSTGTATLNVDLPAGVYLITASYGGMSVQNTITINA